LAGRFSTRQTPAGRAAAYGLALVLASSAVASRYLLESVAPGIGYFGILLAAVMVAGVACGSGPAILTAVSGAAGIALLFLRAPLSPTQGIRSGSLAMLLFFAAAALVVWIASLLRQTVSKARAAEARLAEVFRQIPGAAAILEAPEGRLLLRSAQSGGLLGHPDKTVARSGDLAGYGGMHDDGSPFAPDEYPIVRALKTGACVNGEHIVYRKPDDTVVDLEVHAGPVRTPDGRIVAAVGMAFDVTERMQAERRLKESEAQCRAVAERLRAAVDAGAMGLWELDLATGLLQADGATAAMVGLPHAPAEMDRASFRQMIDPEDRPRTNALLEAAIAEGGSYADECRVRLPDGSSRWLVVRGTVLRDMGKLVGVVSDITERREREDALQAALHARDVLMHEADHRIKNSLQLVVSLLRLQLSKAELPETEHALSDAIARVDAIANAHLALQRSPNLRSIEVDQMLHDLCARMGPLNPAVAMRCEANSGVSLDAEQAIPLGLIASELLTNALRHAFPPGTQGEVALIVATAAGTLSMTVRDSGKGLPGTPAQQGLGSTVVAALARQIGASTTSQSAPGQGTRVTISMRLASVSEAVAAQ
jgi:PAS domain S-box-containing protein